ncbi:unnamed protein product [Durusdinium trenchii]|uniref:Uncharacterized protein n=1 Tax=Durusdinium trenchii TaxID=1381693 RepID=A0ABP0L483_9DINO
MRSLNHRLRTWLAGGLALCLLRRGISFAAKGMDVERLVRSSVPNCRSITFQNEQLMGFSGAKVADVRCVCDDAEELLLFLKVVEPTPLPATASAVEACQQLVWGQASRLAEMLFTTEGFIQCSRILGWGDAFGRAMVHSLVHSPC